MADYYHDTAGSNTAPYDTWAKAATDPQTIVDLATAGDSCHCRGTFTQTSKLDFDTNNGTAANPILYIGYNAFGVEDGTLFILDGNSAAANNVDINARSYLIFRNFKGINATSSACKLVGSTIDVDQYNCAWDDSGSYGIQGTNTNYRSCYINVRCKGNSNVGFYQCAREGEMHFCEASNNGSHGFLLNTDNYAFNCLAHNNTGRGFWLNSSRSGVVLSTSDWNTDGIYVGGNHGMIGLNRLTNNSGYGINHAGASNLISFQNAFYNNTSGEKNGTVTSINDITLTSDGYTDRANDDFSLSSSGEGVAVETLVGATGALTTSYPTTGFQPAYSGGGGGLLTHPSMNGGMNG